VSALSRCAIYCVALVGLLTMLTAEEVWAQDCELCGEALFICSDVDEFPEEFEQGAKDYCDGKPGGTLFVAHKFFLNFASWCDGPEPSEDCRACGLTSTCHEKWDHGPCHVACNSLTVLAEHLIDAIAFS
jgi:hypothetical protein